MNAEQPGIHGTPVKRAYEADDALGASFAKPDDFEKLTYRL